jgi:sigma-B regulation protein RsbU (phosphoserine phosphatase)
MTYDEDRDWMIFIVDVIDENDSQNSYTTEDFFSPGTVWKVDEETRQLLTDPEKDAYTVYSTGSGMVVSKASPVYGEDGEMIGYIGVDIMLADVISTKRTFLLQYCLAIGSIVLLLSLLLLWILSRSIVRPIESLEEGCQNFINRLGTELVEAPHYFADLKLHTGDEIEKLWLMLGDLEINVAISMRRIKKMTTEKERVEAELTVANQIQSSMLPCTFPAFPDRSEFDLYAEMVPAKEVGGDLYDYFLTDDDHLALVIADVSGKGISAALFMVMTKQLLKSHTMSTGPDPVKILTDVNALLIEDNSAHLFVTVFLGILTISTGSFVYANAGHEYPAIRRKDGEFTIDKDIHSAPVATRKKTVFKINELTLEPGDTMYLYTDGVTEARNKDNKMFGKDRLLAALNEVADSTPRELDSRLRRRVKEFENGKEPFDDCTTLCLKYYGSQNHVITGSSEKKMTKVLAVRDNLPTVQSFIKEGMT